MQNSKKNDQNLKKTERALKKNEVKKELEAEKLASLKQKAQKKLVNYQELYDSNQRLIYLGKKIRDLGDNFLNNGRKRELLSELFKLVQIENSKKEKLSNKQKIDKLTKQNRLQKEVEKKLVNYIVKRIHRSYSKIFDFIYKIDEMSLKKKKSIDLKIIKEVLGE